MDLAVSTSLPDSLATLKRAQAYRAPTSSAQPATRAVVDNLPTVTQTPASFETSGTRLVSESRQELENGYRLTKTFEREDGRAFTRVEDFAFTERGARRTVYQQNPSGNITEYEEVLDREGGGTFRRTQRFRDESGESLTQVTPNYTVTDPFILTGGAAPSDPLQATPFGARRGTQLDLSA